MEINRVFVPAGKDPFTMFEYETYDCVIVDWKTGKAKSEQHGCEVPKHWSKNARDILIDKYFRKAGVPQGNLQKISEKKVPTWLQPSRPDPLIASIFGGEVSVKQVVHRLAGHWAYVGFANGYFDEVNAHAFYDEVVYMLLNQMMAPNSPQWFNTGLWWAYGVTGKSGGHHYVDLSHDTRKQKETVSDMPFDMLQDFLGKALKETTDSYKRVQAHACFILKVEDKMCGPGGILDWYTREGRIFKYGSGSGANVSKLRGRMEKLSGGGYSSGLMSWLRTADYNGGAIKSGGTTRRAAKMLILNIDHPDILEFVDCKVESEIAVEALVDGSRTVNSICQQIMDRVQLVEPLARSQMASLLQQPAIVDIIDHARRFEISDNYIDKALRLAMNGEESWPGHTYDSDFEGKAYTMVPWQNANNSVRIPSSFYTAVDKNENWDLTLRTTGKIAASMPARDLEHRIARAAWFSGDPGVQYDCNVNDWNVTPVDGRINGSNPCSEHMRPDGSACNLLSHRLMKFLRDDGDFDIWTFRHAVSIGQIILDITNTMAALPDKDTAVGTYMWRDTGLGFADLGGVLMNYGLPYDSDEGRALAGAITALMHAEAHLTSAKMAKELGAYPRFWANKEHHLRCVRNHMAAYSPGVPYEGLKVEPPKLDLDALQRALQVGTIPPIKWTAQIAGIFQDAYDMAKETGFRNAEMTLLAPTGTISILMDCDTTGVEPNLGLIVFKQLVGGSNMKLSPAGAVKLALKRLGYAEREITSITEYIRDHNGLVPVLGDRVDNQGWRSWIEAKHMPVFQCSLSQDRNNPAISWPAHVKMMAAVQPFLSGAISKTINMNQDASINDIKQAYRMAHDLGLKAVAVYRDASKLSQPLTLKVKSPSARHDIAKAASDAATKEIQRQADKEAMAAIGPRQLEREDRARLGSIRHAGIDIRVKCGDGNLYLKTTRYPNGKVGEIWMTYSADQGTLQAMLDNVCKMANVGLQYGVPLSVVVRTWTDTKFEPNGVGTDHPFIKTYRSILNLASKLLSYHELGDDSVCEVPPPKSTSKPVDAKQDAVQKVSEAIAELQNEGPLGVGKCPECGAKTFITTGASCKKCTTCGYSPGCG